MANTGYNRTSGTVHNEWKDFEDEDLGAITRPFQPTDLSFTEHPVDCFPYLNETSSRHDQEHLQPLPSTFEGDRSFDLASWRAPPGMAPAIANSHHIVFSPRPGFI
jgi:hypothetical protein